MFLDTTVKRDFHWPGLAYALRVAVQRGPSANLQKGSSSTARLPGFAIKASRTSTALSPRAPAFTLDNSRMGMARARLSAERKAWRNNHPHGFVAKPQNLPDGTQDLLNWEVIIPGKTGTIWEGACIPMSMAFTEDYPDKPPVCKFKLVGSSQKPLSSIRTCTRVARSA